MCSPGSSTTGQIVGSPNSRLGAGPPSTDPRRQTKPACQAVQIVAVAHRLLINPMLRGWVNYFAVGNSSECFTYIRDWVEKKVRRQLAHARKRKGFGWERWSRPWLYDTLGLFNSYRVRHDGPKVAPV